MLLSKKSKKWLFVFDTISKPYEMLVANPIAKIYLKNPKFLFSNPAWECLIEDGIDETKNEYLTILLKHMAGYDSIVYGSGIIVFHTTNNCKELFEATKRWFQYINNNENLNLYNPIFFDSKISKIKFFEMQTHN